MARIFVGVGKNHGVRPGDLVGAIANETRVDGPDIGKINVAPNFTIVEGPTATLAGDHRAVSHHSG
jgi:ATP-dependent RNA helicase DeaD